MIMAFHHQDVAFKTCDGLTLRGWLFPAKERGPGLLMTPGINFPKNYLYEEVAGYFQRAGVTTLVYDVRSVGESDGMPRADINPSVQTKDIHDAVTFLKSQPTVDPQRIAAWGYSVSAATTMVAAALDKRIKLILTLCPAIPFNFEEEERRTQFLARAIQDRESQLRGNKPYVFPFVGDDDGTALLDAKSFKNNSKIDFDKIIAAMERIPHFRNEITIQTFYNLISWPWQDFLKYISPTPVLQINAADEEMEFVRNGYEAIFNSIGEPKQRHVEPDKGHMDILLPDPRLGRFMKLQTDFLLKYLGDDAEEPLM